MLDRSASTNADLTVPSPLDAMDLGPPAPDLAAVSGVTTRGAPTVAEEEQLTSDVDLADPGAVLAELPGRRGETDER